MTQYTLTYFKKRLQNLPNNIRNSASLIESKFTKQKLATAYWCNYNNAGDQMTPRLLRHYGYIPYCVDPSEASIASVGSILEHLPDDFSGKIIGSGFMIDESRMDFEKAEILGVRGKLTLRAIKSAPKNAVLGDPGALADRLVPRNLEERHAIGIIPHYIDASNPIIAKLVQENRGNLKFIDIATSNAHKVLREIASCQSILSSSLHGLIFADSLGKPSGWFSAPNLEGKDFKFRDYYSVFEEEMPTCLQLTNSTNLMELERHTKRRDQNEMNDYKSHLNDVFESL